MKKIHRKSREREKARRRIRREYRVRKVTAREMVAFSPLDPRRSGHRVFRAISAFKKPRNPDASFIQIAAIGSLIGESQVSHFVKLQNVVGVMELEPRRIAREKGKGVLVARGNDPVSGKAGRGAGKQLLGGVISFSYNELRELFRREQAYSLVEVEARDVDTGRKEKVFIWGVDSQKIKRNRRTILAKSGEPYTPYVARVLRDIYHNPNLPEEQRHRLAEEWFSSEVLAPSGQTLKEYYAVQGKSMEDILHHEKRYPYTKMRTGVRKDG